MNDKTAGATPAPPADEPRSLMQLKDGELKTMHQLVTGEMDRRGLLGPTAGKRLAALAIEQLQAFLDGTVSYGNSEEGRLKFEAIKFAIIANADIRTSEG